MAVAIRHHAYIQHGGSGTGMYCTAAAGLPLVFSFCRLSPANKPET